MSPAAAAMRAVVFHGPRDIRLEEKPVPLPGPGEVVVRIGTALTCGTDFKAYRRGHRVLLGDPPSPFGHEMAGTVTAAGPGAEAWKPGTRVVVGNSAPCDGCYYCDRGQNFLCDRLKLHNGAYAEYNLVPANIVRHNLHVLPDSVPFEAAALSEPLACALHAAEEARVQRGETAVVIGAGIMGRLLLGVLKARGAKVIMVGRGRAGLDAAEALGADAVFGSSDGDPVKGVQALTDGRGGDAVFEAVGLPVTWASALAMTRKGGRACLFGGCAAGTEVSIDAHRVHYEALTLFGVFHHTPAYFKAALGLLSSGLIASRGMVEGSIPLSDVPRYFAENADRSLPKTAVVP
ncbi:MAG: zinc-binding dehydrogenase [Elusimicrobia bacterium]|nr:zinc-binding dehydrogenase [Elusimicrobiota bacterium]